MIDLIAEIGTWAEAAEPGLWAFLGIALVKFWQYVPRFFRAVRDLEPHILPIIEGYEEAAKDNTITMPERKGLFWISIEEVAKWKGYKLSRMDRWFINRMVKIVVRFLGASGNERDEDKEPAMTRERVRRRLRGEI